ncbi:NACHT domain-containing protein [Bacillus cereus]|uniref:NACHT domain-containing protein n=1 Tax=Bacillus cereus group TaxID=86661 RepID=UPI0023497F94|nr:hypothetical protein [Bacillus cereus]
MGKMNYSWNRYWYEREEKVIFDHDGFIVNPKDNKEQKLVTFKSISYKTCLILLGGPGIGKSNTIEMEYCKLKQELVRNANKIDKVEFVDLSKISTREDLKEELLENPFFDEWINGNGHLYLFLDSFDESFIKYESLTNMLIKKFREHKSKLYRLTLRIASRIILEVFELEKELKKLWGEDSCGIYQLAPLCKEDIIKALEENNISTKDFIKEIKNKNLVSFTGTPVTLQMLIGYYHTGYGVLPNSRIDIYKQGCRGLVSEVNPSRKTKQSQAGRLSEIECLNLISIIATITLFCNKSIVNTSGILGVINKSEIGYVDIETIMKLERESDVEEALRTALFVARGTNKYGWAHLTYAEFLAANFINEHLNNDQIMNLLIHPNDSEEKIIPQLHATAAWIAGMNPVVFEEILERDYNVLFLVDFTDINGIQKERFIDKFLNSLNKRDNRNFYANYQIYSSLNHINLKQQLRDFILNTTNDEIAVVIAMEIAIQCNIDFKQEYLDLALNRSGEIQEKAILSYLKYASNTELVCLKPLITNGVYLRDSVLEHILDLFKKNNLIETEEFMTALLKFKINQTPDEERLLRLVNNFKTIDFKIALKWGKDKLNLYSSRTFTYVIDLLIYLILKRFDNETIIESLIEEILYSRYESGKPIISKDPLYILKDGLDKKKKITIYLLELEHKLEIPYMELVANQLFTVNDLSWLMSIRARKNSVLSWNSIDRLIEKLNKQIKENRKKEETLLKDEVLVRKEVAAIDLSIDNAVDSWIRFCNQPLLNEFNINFLIDPRKRIRLLLINENVKQKLIKAALNYLLTYQLDKESFYEMIHFTKDVEAGKLAFEILYEAQQDILITLPETVWEKWAPIIIYSPYSSPFGEKWNHDILKLAIKINKSIILNGFMDMLDKRDVIRNLITDFCYIYWCDKLAESILERVESDKTDINKIVYLLGALLKKGYKKGYEYAVSILTLPIPNNSDCRNKAIEIATCLISKGYDAGWNTIWGVINTDKQFGIEIFHRIDTKGYSKGLHLGILIGNKYVTEKDLKELYLWIETNLCNSQEKIVDNSSCIGWQGSILHELRDRANKNAYEAIKEIVEALPNDMEALYMWSSIKHNYIRDNWIPHSPKDISKLLLGGSNLLIYNEKQLLEAILKSLDRLQKKLQGETPAMIDLWNESKENGYRPKNENAFSDYIKRHLEEDLNHRGIIVNREVEIRRGYGTGSGERTDIQINAIIKDHTEQRNKKITVIIEVKGCWHRELDIAMEEQLINRYLSDNECNYGIYLVGWFYCKQWRKSTVTFEEKGKYFKEKAKDLSNKHKVTVVPYIMNTALRE